MSEHKSRAKTEKHKKIPIYVHINKFGFESIEWTVLHEFNNLTDAENMERTLISANKPYGLNILSGGMGTDNTNPELRRRVSEGEKGRIVSEETKAKIRECTIRQFSTKESRLKHSKIAIKIHSDPEYRKRYLDGMAKRKEIFLFNKANH